MNKRSIILFLALAGCIFPQNGPHAGTFNFATDIAGDLETREATWGRAGAAVWFVTFKAPPDMRVEIISIQGDLVSWPTQAGAIPAVVEPGRFAGVLMGLGNSRSGNGSARADWMDDNTFLYIQDVVDQQGSRTSFQNRFESCAAVLRPDHKLMVKVAAWLNDTGHLIHMEPTATVQYRFIEESKCQSH